VEHRSLELVYEAFINTGENRLAVAGKKYRMMMKKDKIKLRYLLLCVRRNRKKCEFLV